MTILQNSVNANSTSPLHVVQGGTGLASTTANQILYSSATNTIAGITTAGNSVLITSSGGTPSISATLPTAVQTNITEVGTVTVGTYEAIVTKYTETVFKATASGTYTINLANGNWQELTMNSNTTFSFSGVPATSGQGVSLTLVIIQGSGGSFIATWPASIDWGKNLAPTLSTAAGDADMFPMMTSNNGTRWRAGYLLGYGG